MKKIYLIIIIPIIAVLAVIGIEWYRHKDVFYGNTSIILSIADFDDDTLLFKMKPCLNQDGDYDVSSYDVYVKKNMKINLKQYPKIKSPYDLKAGDCITYETKTKNDMTFIKSVHDVLPEFQSSALK